MNANILRVIAVVILVATIAAMTLTAAYGTVPQFVMVSVMALVFGAPLFYGFAHAADTIEA